MAQLENPDLNVSFALVNVTKRVLFSLGVTWWWSAEHLTARRDSFDSQTQGLPVVDFARSLHFLQCKARKLRTLT